MTSPTDRRYSENHVWAKQDGNYVTLGVTEYNIAKMGQLISVSGLVAVGTNLKQGDKMGYLHRSGGGTDDFIAPIGGQVTDRDEHPLDIGYINTDPYKDSSWFIRVDGFSQDEYNALMSAAQYDVFTA